MIYSDDIQKVCSLCVFAERRQGEEIFCTKRNKTVGEADEACKKYKYDILKREVRRRKPPKTDFSEEDFRL